MVEVLSLGIEPLDEMLLGGLETGKLVALKGDNSVLGLSHLFCVRAQLPARRGGIDSQVLWLDGGNTFDPYLITEYSRANDLNPERVLKRIHLSRAFTCYQMSSLISERMPEALRRFKVKLVVISDLPQLYLDSDIPRREAKEIFMGAVDDLRSSLKKELFLVTSFEYPFAPARAAEISNILFSNAEVVLEAREKKGAMEFRLDRHPKAPRRTLSLDTLKHIPLEFFVGGE